MFEGKLPVPADGKRPQGAEQDESALHQLEWESLLSRLSAARELRAALSSDPSAQASFHAHSARRIAGQRDGEFSVNPEDLANRKVIACNEGDTEDTNKVPRGN
jgi:hypothetical protein